MVKIRLMRVGKRKQPSFRVVVADSRSPRDGRIIETIGHYHPREDPSVIEINGERAVHWLQLGAQPSNTVKNLLRITGAWSEFSGEAPPPPLGEAPAKKTAPVKATPAASVSAEGVASETEEGLEADSAPAEETAETASIDEDVADATEDDEAAK
ncbi:MAG: 30S ribosomal protein S16 [Actinobacteria bacterium]|nr:30S ribosomal protein S16 [Actinomycetota bacterium]